MTEEPGHQATKTGARRNGTARKYLTIAAERILADCYPGQIRAVVIERALREMAIRDRHLTPKTGKPQRPA